METIFEILIEIVFLYLFKYPGAFIIWIFTGCRKPFQTIINKDSYLNGTIGIVFIVGIIILLIRI